MTETLLVAVKWTLIALALSPIWGAFLWELWEGSIKPRFIPKVELLAEAKALIEQHGAGASNVAFANEDRAWRYADSFEQARWKRIRAEIEAISAVTAERVET